MNFDQIAREFRQEYEHRVLGGPLFPVDEPALDACAAGFDASLAALLAARERAAYESGFAAAAGLDRAYSAIASLKPEEKP